MVELPSLRIAEVEGGSTRPEPGYYIYPADTPVIVFAVPEDGYKFDYWNINRGAIKATQNPVTINLVADHHLEPHFRKVET